MPVLVPCVWNRSRVLQFQYALARVSENQKTLQIPLSASTWIPASGTMGALFSGKAWVWVGQYGHGLKLSSALINSKLGFARPLWVCGFCQSCFPFHSASHLAPAHTIFHPSDLFSPDPSVETKMLNLPNASFQGKAAKFEVRILHFP